MKWEEKAEMIRLSNETHSQNGGDRTPFLEYAAKHMPSFDNQAWDMFFNCIVIDPDELQKQAEWWKAFWPHIVKLDANNFQFRTGYRIILTKEICENLFKFKL